MSLWSNYLDNLTFKKLTKNIEVDTLIIGGGITGLTTLYYLKNLPSICLVDQNKIGNGITKNTTGKLNYLQETIYTDLQKNINELTAIKYLNSQRYAISLIKNIIKKENIACDLEQVKSYIFTTKNSEIPKIQAEKDFLIKQHIKVKEEELPLNLNSKAAISVSDTYVFNPIKYLMALKNILKTKNIYENTKITNIKHHNNKYYCQANNYQIIAKNVILTCHYPFFTIPFFLPLKSHIEKSYLIAHKVTKNPKITGITISKLHLSFRYYEDKENTYQISLASSHNTAFNQNDAKNFQNVINKFSIKKQDIVAKWSNVDIITDDKLPFIGPIKPNLYLATGFNAWGLSNSILAAKILSNYILNIKNEYQDLFLPHRINLAKLKSLLINTITNSLAFLRSKFPNKNWYTSNIKFKTINGEKIAIYKDKNQKEHLVYTTCPHLKCSLIFNEVEKCWECPCHSSKFSIDGKCLKGPSLKDITYKE